MITEDLPETFSYPLNILVPLLSTMRVLIPHLLIQVAAIKPAGPAPTMRTSTKEFAGGGAMAAYRAQRLEIVLEKLQALGKSDCSYITWGTPGPRIDRVGVAN
jgi:hypothetical protein